MWFTDVVVFMNYDTQELLEVVPTRTANSVVSV
jgi:hypothetical protein